MNYSDVCNRLTQLQHDLREAAGDHAWGHPQALDDLYQRLWKEAKEVTGIEPPVPSVENLQRHNMSQVAEGRAYKALHDDYTLQYKEIAVRVGKDPAWIGRLVRVLDDEAWSEFVEKDHDPFRQLPDDIGIKADILRGAFPDDVEIRKSIARKIVEEGLSREQVKELAKAVKVEGELVLSPDFGMMFTVSVLVLAGQLQTWLGSQIPIGREH
jgi:ParB family chromosome partitioning protein